MLGVDPARSTARAARHGSTQIRSTCQYSRSTGVGRLKMISMTLTRPRASMTSSTVPSKFSNGPSLILTRSPRSTSIRTSGRLLGLGRLLAEHLVDLGLGHLGRRAVGPDEVADAGGLADDEPGLLVQLHLDHDVAGIRLPLDDPLLVVADLGDLLGRDDDPAEVPLQPLDLDPPLQGVADRVLARALDLQDVPDQSGAGSSSSSTARRPGAGPARRRRRRRGAGFGGSARRRLRARAAGRPGSAPASGGGRRRRRPAGGRRRASAPRPRARRAAGAAAGPRRACRARRPTSGMATGSGVSSVG